MPTASAAPHLRRYTILVVWCGAEFIAFSFSFITFRAVLVSAISRLPILYTLSSEFRQINGSEVERFLLVLDSVRYVCRIITSCGGIKKCFRFVIDVCCNKTCSLQPLAQVLSYYSEQKDRSMCSSSFCMVPVAKCWLLFHGCSIFCLRSKSCRKNTQKDSYFRYIHNGGGERQ